MTVESLTRKKRTTVRFYPARLAARALSLLPPPLAERFVARKFAEPQRSRQPTAPSISGMEAHEFAMSSGTYRVAAWDWGRGPTVLLVHGWSGHAGQMIHFAPALVARGFNVIAFDLPAHGQSSGRSCTLPDLADAIHTVAKRFQPVAGVIAHSLGGSATALAISQGMFAEGVVLIAPPVEPKRFIRGLATHLGLPAHRHERAMAEVQRMFSVGLDSLDLSQLAGRFAAPVLIIHDEKDAEVPIENGKALANAWPGARFHRTINLGHQRLLRDPKIISLAVNFIADSHQMRAAAGAPASSAAGSQ